MFLPGAVENGPQHSPKTTKSAKTPKNLKNDTQKPMGYPSLEPTRVHFQAILARIFDHCLDLDFEPSLFTFFKDFGGAFGLVRASAVAGLPLCGALDELSENNPKMSKNKDYSTCFGYFWYNLFTKQQGPGPWGGLGPAMGPLWAAPKL